MIIIITTTTIIEKCFRGMIVLRILKVSLQQ